MTAGSAITAVADNLRSHPLAFALVLVNVLFIAAAVWVLRDIAVNARARDQLLAQCVGKVQEKRDAR
jgi:hypothetical protein